MKENESGEIICPAGHAFTLVSSRLDHRSVYPRINQKYVNEHCGECPLRSKCTKAKNGRTLNRSRDVEKYHKEVRENIESDEGKKNHDTEKHPGGGSVCESETRLWVYKITP